MSFEGKAVLVTGASRGIGGATALEFLNRRAMVAINNRTAESVSKAIADMGTCKRLLAAPGDISTVQGCETAVNVAVQAFGRLDVLVNNAGVAHRLSMAETDEGAWHNIMDTNVKGTYFCSRAALPRPGAAARFLGQVRARSEQGAHKAIERLGISLDGLDLFVRDAAIILSDVGKKLADSQSGAKRLLHLV